MFRRSIFQVMNNIVPHLRRLTKRGVRSCKRRHNKLCNDYMMVCEKISHVDHQELGLLGLGSELFIERDRFTVKLKRCSRVRALNTIACVFFYSDRFIRIIISSYIDDDNPNDHLQRYLEK